MALFSFSARIQLTGGTDSSRPPVFDWRVAPVGSLDFNCWVAPVCADQYSAAESASSEARPAPTAAVWRRKTSPKAGPNRLLRTAEWHHDPLSAQDRLTGGPSSPAFAPGELTGGTDSSVAPIRLVRPYSTDGWHQLGLATSTDGWHQFALATVGSLSTDWNDGWHRFRDSRGRLTGGPDSATRTFRRIICRVAPVCI